MRRPLFLRRAPSAKHRRASPAPQDPISFDAVVRPRPEPRPEVRVSDHAIVRYLERVEGLDLDIVIVAIIGQAAAG